MACRSSRVHGGGRGPARVAARGPEEYLVRKAMPGTYEVKTKFYGSRSAELIGAVTLHVDIYTHYGTPREKKQSLTLRLTERKEIFTVGKVTFD